MTSDLIPHLPMSHVTDFLLRPKDVPELVTVGGVQSVVWHPNPEHWVSDHALDRAFRIMAERSAADFAARRAIR